MGELRGKILDPGTKAEIVDSSKMTCPEESRNVTLSLLPWFKLLNQEISTATVWQGAMLKGIVRVSPSE